MWGRVQRAIGRGIVASAPYLMKTLSVAGTIAMFLVGGGILTHGLPFMHPLMERLGDHAGDVPVAGWVLEPIAPLLASLAVGVAAGALVYAAVALVRRARTPAPSNA